VNILGKGCIKFRRGKGYVGADKREEDGGDLEVPYRMGVCIVKGKSLRDS